jgi:hypothetical protein
MKRFDYTPYEKSRMDDSNFGKKKNLIGIDYVGEGMYNMMMIKKSDIVPLRSSDNLTYLFWLSVDRVGKENILISDTVKEIMSSMKDAPDVSDIKNFILE